MKKNFKKIIWLVIGLIIGISTTVGAATVFNSKDITYSSSATTKKNVKDSLDELYTKANTPWKCATGYYCYTTFCPTGYTQGTDSDGYSICKQPKLISAVKVGDYISMTPTLTSYTISTSLTGYKSNQAINPSELNLWRVIRKNDDGTVDVVSEYIANTKIYFGGQVGYLNFVGTLNTIAAQYTNSKYISKTRHMGYSNQKEKCTEFSQKGCPSDTGYETDKNLVQAAIGTLVASNPSGTESNYWLASRFWNTNNGWVSGFYIASSGLHNGGYFYTSSSVANSNSVRPILTLKSDVQIKSGNGKSASTAYQLS